MPVTSDKQSNAQMKQVSLTDIAQLTPNEKQPIQVVARHMSVTSEVEIHHHLWGQIVFSHSGILQVKSDAYNYLVPPMHAVWIPPSLKHAALLLEEAKLVSVYLQAQEAIDIEVKTHLWSTGDCCLVFKVTPLLHELINNLIQQTGKQAKQYEAVCTLIYSELNKADIIPLGVPEPKEKRLKCLCDRFFAQPTQQITLQQLCSQAGISLSTASRLFKQQLGVGFNQWKQQVILAKAMTLVAQKMPITQVAYELGYANPSVFSAMVNKLVGMTPTDFFTKNKM